MQKIICFGFVVLSAVGFLGCDVSSSKTTSNGLSRESILPQSLEKSKQLSKEVVYTDGFSDLSNQQSVFVNGRYESMDAASTRIVLAFMDIPNGETFSLKILEDSITQGADGQPGVLALSWDKTPTKAAYSGFTYHGRKKSGGQIGLPFVNAAKDADDLRGYRLRFRFKAVNLAAPVPMSLQAKCRLEPLVANSQSYEKRLELPILVASEEWQQYDAELQYGQNMEAFLASVHEERPEHFKMIWSQNGPVTRYRAGDTLLIDDIEIVGLASAP